MHDLLEKIDQVVARLSVPPDEQEIRNGWTTESKLGMRGLFEKMRQDVIEGRDLGSAPEYIALARGMDHWGISGGELFDAAAAIGVLAASARKS